MAKSQNKNFQARFLFHTKTKTTYQDELPKNDTPNFLYAAKCIRKSLKSCKNVDGKISHFCLRPKT